MANDESESEPFAATREPPPRALTRVSPMVRRLVAPNASPFTFNGTCTYIVGEARVAIVDPGPADDSHLSALLAAVDGEQVETILVTHTHRDHVEGVRKLRAATGAQVVGAAPFMARGDGSAGLDSAHDRDYSPDAVLADGERWRGAGFTIEAIATPGHCANHLCFALLEENALFSGDHVMAWSTSVVAPPDGSMRAYMDSLDKLRGRAETLYWPGHGGPVRRTATVHTRADPSPASAGGLDPEHACGRPADHSRARRQGLCRPEPVAHAAAGLSTLAHLEDLSERGMVVGEAAGGGEAALSPRLGIIYTVLELFIHRVANPGNLVFLGDWPFPFGKRCLLRLDFLGFPWILSSESGLINGLRGIFARKFFIGPSSLTADARQREIAACSVEIHKSSCMQLNLISDFPQSLVGDTYGASLDHGNSDRAVAARRDWPTIASASPNPKS